MGVELDAHRQVLEQPWLPDDTGARAWMEQRVRESRCEGSVWA